MIDLEQLKADVAAGTPGDWELRENSTEPGYYYISGRGAMVVTLTEDNSGNSMFDMSDPDARRIARVPELEAAVIAQAAEIARLRTAISGLFQDYMTSENHHPNHVLVSKNRFELLRALGE